MKCACEGYANIWHVGSDAVGLKTQPLSIRDKPYETKSSHCVDISCVALGTALRTAIHFCRIHSYRYVRDGILQDIELWTSKDGE